MPSLWELGFQHMNLRATYIQSITQCYPSFAPCDDGLTPCSASFPPSCCHACLYYTSCKSALSDSFSARVWTQIITHQLETLVQNIESRNEAEAFSLPLLIAFFWPILSQKQMLLQQSPSVCKRGSCDGGSGDSSLLSLILILGYLFRSCSVGSLAPE